VKSKNVRPPMGLGRVSLVCIGENSSIDSQPCGGTHVSETQEVGRIHIAKIEKKGKENRLLVSLMMVSLDGQASSPGVPKRMRKSRF
ncbi:hypothetical protein ACC697_38785, partial [Rhizobium ruizarguesonis]